MDFNNYYNNINNKTYKHLNTVSESQIKKEISRSICDILREKKTVGYRYTDINKYYNSLYKNFFDPDNENTRSLYKNRIYITKLRENLMDATKKIIEGDYTIPAFEIDNEKLTNTFKKSVYKTLRSKQAPKKKKNKKGIKVK